MEIPIGDVTVLRSTGDLEDLVVIDTGLPLSTTSQRPMLRFRVAKGEAEGYCRAVLGISQVNVLTIQGE